MEDSLKNQTIKYSKHFSAVLGIPCTVIDFDEKTLTCSLENNQVDICQSCPHVECKGYQQYSKGCKEAYRWDGLYIFHCPQEMVLVCASVNDEKGNLAGGLVLGPIVLDNKDDLISGSDNPEFIKIIESIPDMVPNKIQGMAELLAAIAGNVSNLSYGKAGRYFYRQESLLNAMYVEKMKTPSMNDYYTYPIVMEEKLRSAIKNRDKEGSQIILNQMLAYIYTYNNYKINEIKPRITELMVIISRAAVDAGANIQEIYMINENFNNTIMEFNEMEDLSVWVSGMLQRFISLTFEFEKAKHADIVYKTINYIKKNYSRHITLDEIAAESYISKTYLSTLFKKETSYSIFEYINNVRIEKSQSLLTNSKLDILEISNICGFDNQSYFTKVFKKIVGTTPKKYRESRGRLNNR